MTPETPQPIPDPRKLQPDGLSNGTKRWMFFGIFGVIVLIILANIVGSSPAGPAAKTPQPPKQQQQNPTAAQLEEYTRNLQQQQALLLDKTKTDAANLERLRSGQNQISAADLQQAAALREAAQAQQQYQFQQQQYVAQQSRARDPVVAADKRRQAAALDSMVHQDHGQAVPVLAPWQQRQQPLVKNNEGEESGAERSSKPILPTASHTRKPLDFDPARKTNWLPEGTLLEAVITNRLDGEGTGPVNAMITTDIYLPGTRTLVIPQGARVLGEASKVSLSGQQRLAVAFHRILVPGEPSYTIPLDVKPPALAQAGEVGLRDQVNNHYASIFGASLAVGAIGGLAQIGNGQSGFGFDPAVQFRNGVSQTTAQSSERILDKFLNRLPTLTIREGTRARILLTDDLQVPTITKGDF